MSSASVAIPISATKVVRVCYVEGKFNLGISDAGPNGNYEFWSGSMDSTRFNSLLERMKAMASFSLEDMLDKTHTNSL